MEKKLTKQEAMEMIEEIIIRKADETGRPYHEISREMREKLIEYMKNRDTKENGNINSFI